MNLWIVGPAQVGALVPNPEPANTLSRQGASTLNVRTSLIETFPASSMASTYQR